jgi:8-oxo-dGTP diphosphatase
MGALMNGSVGSATTAVGRDIAAVRPKVAVDTVLFAIEGGRLKCYLVQLHLGTAAGKWAFPGGLVRVGETLDEAARRELEDAAGLRDLYLDQLFSFGDPSRDPGAHVVSVSYMGLIADIGAAKLSSVASAGERAPGERPSRITGASETSGATMGVAGSAVMGVAGDAVRGKDGPQKYADGQWFEVGTLPSLAYDHSVIADYAVQRLRSKLIYTDIARNLVPPTFSLAELREIYQTVLERGVDRRNFHRRVNAMGLLKRLPEKRRGAHRPATLYAFQERSDEVYEMI